MEKRRKLKELSPKERVEYIWEYYHWHFFAVIFILFLAISLIRQITAQKEPLLEVAMVNSGYISEEEDNIFGQFLNEYGYDDEKYSIEVNANVRFDSDIQSEFVSTYLLAALVSSGETDVFFWKDHELDSYIEDGLLMDLSKILDQECLEKYQDTILYTSGKEGKEPYPYGIKLGQNHPWIRSYGRYNECCVGVYYNTQNIQAAKELINYLLQAD